MTDCLGDCFERDEENRRVLQLKANGGIACGPDGLYTYPHDQNFASNYIGHSAFQGYYLSTPNPINTGILAPASDGIQHTAIPGTVITNSWVTNALLTINAKADLYIMPRVPLVEAIAALNLKVSIDGTNWADIQHSSYHSINLNAGYSSGQNAAMWLLTPGQSVTPSFGVFYTNISGAGAAFIRATTLAITTTLHAQ